MKRFFISIIFAIAFILVILINDGYGGIASDALIATLGVGYFEINGAAIIEVSMRMIPFWLFQILCGNQIYLNVCDGGIYYLYRCSNRIHWIFKQLSILFFYCFAYGVIYYSIASLFAYLRYGSNVWENALLTIWGVLMLTLFLFGAVVAINLLSFIYNSAAGTLIVIGMQMLCIALFLLFQRGAVFDIYTNASRRNMTFLKCNYMAHFVTSWHDLGGSQVSTVNISMLSTMILYSAAALIISIVFAFIVRNLDIVEEKRN